MTTDPLPRQKRLQREFRQSDALCTLKMPKVNRLRGLAKVIESALEVGHPKALQRACGEFLEAAAQEFGVETPVVRILPARPLRTRENGPTTELFGDYNPATKVIRLWMRTAVQKRITSFGTLFSTLCHEFCHHLDLSQFGFRDSPHTRGFYERTAVLYHHARGTPRKKLYWLATWGNCWQIDWPRTNGVRKAGRTTK